ncbi:MAG: polysaccharide deacetylase family protein [Planctomycetales bacterium]|nr:polysaccharide deacetylase family protein [Planctomycetales bacterium]
MNARNLALQAYYCGTYPVRRFFRACVEASGQAPLCVLFYHRVADSHPNEWTISNREFQRQMLWLKRNVDLVSLEEIQSRMRSGRNDRIAAAITFDDGYAENADRAIPFLLENEIPTTYFVALDFVMHKRCFPHDVDRGVPLAANTPKQIRAMADAGVEIGAHTRSHCDVGAIADVTTMIDEIDTTTDELETLINRPIRYFAFPFGLKHNLSAAAAHLINRRGMLGVCSAFGAYNFPGDDPFHIKRIHGDPDFIRLKNWITIDQRKMHHGRGFTIPETAVKVSDVQSRLESANTAKVSEKSADKKSADNPQVGPILGLHPSLTDNLHQQS